MDFLINDKELAALCGLPHVQQLAYLRGIRPYMDVKTGTVGIKRGISYQSIAEQLYVEPHQGIKSQGYSRMQVRRALAGLNRSGLITPQSEGLKLILKCDLATRDYFVPNKVDPNPTQQPNPEKHQKNLTNTDPFVAMNLKTDRAEFPKADLPLKEDNYYIFLLSQFEQFWTVYPNKKSRQKAWDAFQKINPDAVLFNKIMTALGEQITHGEELARVGDWVPSWKYPANWLAQQCWDDELTPIKTQEYCNAKSTAHCAKKSSVELFWASCGDTDFDFNFNEGESKQPDANNIVPFNKISTE